MVKGVKDRVLRINFGENYEFAIFDLSNAKQLDISMKGDANCLKSV